MYPNQPTTYYQPVNNRRRPLIWIAGAIAVLAIITVIFAALTASSTGTKTLSNQFVKYVAAQDVEKSFAMLSTDFQERMGTTDWGTEIQPWKEPFSVAQYTKELSQEEKENLSLGRYTVQEFTYLQEQETKRILIIFEQDEKTQKPAIASFYAD